MENPQHSRWHTQGPISRSDYIVRGSKYDFLFFFFSVLTHKTIIRPVEFIGPSRITVLFAVKIQEWRPLNIFIGNIYIFDGVHWVNALERSVTKRHYMKRKHCCLKKKTVKLTRTSLRVAACYSCTALVLTINTSIDVCPVRIERDRDLLYYWICRLGKLQLEIYMCHIPFRLIKLISSAVNSVKLAWSLRRKFLPLW